MALLNVNFFSYTLGMDSSMTVLLPEKRQKKPVANPDKKYPVLYLLHGHSDDHTSWIRKSKIELLIRDYEVIVVMPTTHRAFYTNSKHGHNYLDYFTQELPVVVANFFPASLKREDTYVAGLSMGGYGALKLALNFPDKYAGAASMSGALKPIPTAKIGAEENIFTVKDFYDNLLNIFGSQEEYKNSINDLEYMILQLDKSNGPKPKLYQSCGLQDPLYKTNTDYRDFIIANTNTLDYTYNESKGNHNWEYWNKELPEILRHFELIE